MKTLYESGSKTFLTDAFGEDSSISWHVETVMYGNSGPASVEGTVKIRDCHKLVAIEFYQSGSKDAQQKIDKIDTLIDSLNQFKAKLIEAQHFASQSDKLIIKGDHNAD